MIKLGVIILNYIAYKTTMDTMASFFLQNHDGFEVKYIIVDNYSPNESFEKLSEKYSMNANVKVIKSNQNLGFANGNNYGYYELIKSFDPDFVIVSNDDILLKQEGLFQWIKQSYDKWNFAVLGPDIYSINGKYHQSPMENFSTKYSPCKKILNDFYKQYYMLKIKKLLGKKNVNTYPNWKNQSYDSYCDNKTLHGSFQVFSRDYLEKYDEIYDPSTFLYMEERILKVRCDKSNLNMIYDPSYKVEHLQAVSTNLIHKNSIDKEINRYNNLITSLKAYIRIIKR